MAIANDKKDVIDLLITYSDSYQAVPIFARIDRKYTGIFSVCVVFWFLNAAFNGNPTK